MLNKRDSYVEIWGDDRGRGIVYGQNQDDGTGRLVRRNFNVNGWEVDNNGKVIDPEWVSPEEEERIAQEAALKTAAEKNTLRAGPVTWEDTKPDLLIADRIKIKNPNTPGYLEAEDIQEELKKMDVRYHYRAGREKLLNLLKEELQIGVESG